MRAVMDALGARGEARFVGGCVRDSLLGRPPAGLAGEGAAGTTDIDVATTLPPEETTAALEAAGLSAHPTGIEHGTVTAVSGGLPVEVTTLRADVETDGRHAVVRFTTDWDEDWRRRDFRVNAIYRGADGALYDPAGGVADLRAARVRFIGEAARRIEEDALRILRFFRFSARYAERLDEGGLAACEAGAALMAPLSKERLWQETARWFSAPRAPMSFEAADGAGILERLVASGRDLAAFSRLHEVGRGEVPPALGLCALWPGAETRAFKAAFKPSGAVLARVDAARKASDALPDGEGTALRRALYRAGPEALSDALTLAFARSGAARWLALRDAAAALDTPVFPLRGRDLTARGVTPGPELGRLLAAIEARWIDAGLPADPTAVEAMARDVLRKA